MKPSNNCYDLIRQYEGFSAKAYLDPGSGNLPITIGYGSTTKTDGTRFNIGDTITQPDAEKLLEWEVNNKATIVSSLLRATVINQNQFDALVSFTYNVGTGNFKSSTLLKKIKINPNDATLLNEFKRWNKAGGKEMDGLTNRRIAEYNLYHT